MDPYLCPGEKNGQNDGEYGPVAYRQAAGDQHSEHGGVDWMANHAVNSRRYQLMIVQHSGLQTPLFAEFPDRSHREPGGICPDTGGGELEHDIQLVLTGHEWGENRRSKTHYSDRITY